MQRWMLSVAMGGALTLGLAPALSADEMTDLRSEVQVLKAELAQMRSAQGDNWLNERRAEEVKGLIREVLSDAEMRASLQGDGIMAGHNGSHFFMQSADGGFLMEVGGQVQFRYIANNAEDRADETDSGFQLRRTKINFGGHIADPKIGYFVQIATDYTDGNVFLEDAILSYDLTDDLKLSGGKFKLPFLREELTSSKYQLAVERSSVAEFFTLNRAEQIQLAYDSEMIRAAVSVNDGSNSETSDYASDAVEAAFTGRVDIKLTGDWDQARDFSAWSGEDLALFVGGAAHYELGDGANGAAADYFAWTVDGSVETNGLNVFAAFNGGHINPDAAGAADRDMYGAVAQAGYQVIADTLEPFVRWEWLDDDAAGTENLQVASAGFNWFFKGHNAKLTTDLVWIYEGDDPVANPYGANELSTGLGLLGGLVDAEDQVALRAQFQLLF